MNDKSICNIYSIHIINGKLLFSVNVYEKYNFFEFPQNSSNFDIYKISLPISKINKNIEVADLYCKLFTLPLNGNNLISLPLLHSFKSFK